MKYEISKRDIFRGLEKLWCFPRGTIIGLEFLEGERFEIETKEKVSEMDASQEVEE